MSFQNMGLMPELLTALKEKGYEEATPIQSQSIPRILLGGDVLGGAQTGTGKTAAFALPILQKLHKQKRRENAPRALILTPTRELAAQIQESFRDYGRGLNLRSTVIFGGVGIHPQIDRLRRGVDILVATPGRLLDHADRGTVDLSKVEVFVLDEADRMLDMGFIHDIRKVIRLVPEKRQSLLFSATYSNEIKALADKMLNKPELVEVAAENATADKVDQIVYPVARKRKVELLTQLITEGNWHQVLVFTRTKHGANRLSGQLSGEGISAMAIHGNKSQTARTQALADFKAGRIQVLVATDIAARGLDISMLPHVVNYELPDQAENYVHRIGRTGRAGQEGRAVSLVCPEEKKELQDIEKLLRQSLPVEKIQGFERILPHEIGERPGRRRPGNSRPKGNPSGKNTSRAEGSVSYGSWQKDSDTPRSSEHGGSGRSGNQYGKRSNSRRKSSSSRNQNNRARYS